VEFSMGMNTSFPPWERSISHDRWRSQTCWEKN